MKRILVLISMLFFSGLATGAVYAGPEEDRQALRKFYEERFPGVPANAHKDGVYAIDSAAHEQWQEMEEFPLYEIAVDEGEELFNVAFTNGTGYSDCFANEGAVKHNYPYFDEETKQVVTLEQAINSCRTSNGESAFDYGDADMNRLTAYIAFVSRGNIVNVAEPTSTAALAAYEAGKQFYLTRRGHLNFSCSSCHVQLAGNNLRSEKLSASPGHPTHWPVYRFKWQDIGSLHKRFMECNSQVGAIPLEPQSEVYRNLEYFLSYLSNGMELNGPSTRK